MYSYPATCHDNAVFPVCFSALDTAVSITFADTWLCMICRAVVLSAMGGYGSYLGWQIRLGEDEVWTSQFALPDARLYILQCLSSLDLRNYAWELCLMSAVACTDILLLYYPAGDHREGG